MRKMLLLAALIVLSARSLFAVEFNIIIDGAFEDWSSVPVAYSKPAGGTGTEILTVKSFTDSRFIFIYLELSKEIVLNKSNVSFFFDADINQQTGSGNHGADIVWHFSNMRGQHIVGNSTDDLTHSLLNLVALPSYSSNKFEFAIERNVAVKGKVLFPGVATKFWMTTDTDQSNEEAPPIIQLDGERIFAAPVTFERASGADIRIATINAKMDNIFTPLGDAAFGKLLPALRPDIIAFEEIYDHSAKELSDQVTKHFPDASPMVYHYFKVQPEIVLLSRWQILDWENVNGNGVFLLNTEANFGRNIVVIAAHLPAGDKDSARTVEADKLAKTIADMRSGNFKFKITDQTPIIMLGDFNLVGSSSQYYALKDGKLSTGGSLPPDGGKISFEQAKTIQPYLPMAYTWRNVESDYSPTEMDYIFYTSSQLDLKNSFALFTEELPYEFLAQYGFDYSTSSDASDHLPIVADFAVKTLSVSEPEISSEVFPNPAAEYVTAPELNGASYKIYTTTGNIAKQGTVDSDRIEVKELPAGLYIIQATSNGSTRLYKFVKQ